MWKEYFIPVERHRTYLSDRIQEGTLPHAMLFYGPEGSGKLLHVLWAIQLIFCKSPQNGTACGTCQNCKRTDHLTHPDIHFLLPSVAIKGKKREDVISQDFYPQWRAILSENPYVNAYQWIQYISNEESKQGNINAGDCSNAYRTLNMQSFEGSKKILVVWMAGYLGKDGNRLLKLIEEPPEDTHIFLVAEHRDQILPTIQSRCQQLYFQPYSTDAIAAYLVAKGLADETKAATIALVSEGNMNEALHTSGQSGAEFESLFGTWVKACVKQDPSGRVSWSDMMHKTPREEQKQLLRYILLVLRKTLLNRAGLKIEASDLEFRMIEYLSEKVEQDTFHTLADALNDAIAQITRNAHPKITWMHCSILFRKALSGRKIEPVGVYS